jgi:hypothetical protein
MKKILLYIIFFTSIHTHCQAILPPLWQGAAEIKAIMEDKRFGEHLHSGEIIEEIKRVDSGWLIRTNQNQLQVIVTYLPAATPGPTEFSLHFETSSRSSG